jgi:hypothetical protein
VVKRCPCCGNRTGCVTCPICFWTDDGRDDTGAPAPVRPDPAGPNGELSLRDARLNFSIYGASHPRYVDVVRAPYPDELP